MGILDLRQMEPPSERPTVPILLAGKVSMDMITADITDKPDIEFGTEVTLWGGFTENR
jgi:alanine racemase